MSRLGPAAGPQHLCYDERLYAVRLAECHTWTPGTQGLNTSNAVTAFERMEEKVIALEAEAESTLQARSLLWLRFWLKISVEAESTLQGRLLRVSALRSKGCEGCCLE